VASGYWYKREKKMQAILTIDTTTSVCSLALATENGIAADRIESQANNHSKVIGLFAKELIDEAAKNKIEICAVAISKGPGSYTGLRIGTSFAKGFCYGNNIPLIAIPTLKTMAYGALQKLGKATDTLLCPMIDARRMEVYSALYNSNLDEVEAVKANIIDSNSYKDTLSEKKIYFFGNGSDKCKQVIENPNALFLDKMAPLATDMGELAWEEYKKGSFVDVAYFEPFYLKEYIATISKNKLL